MPSEVERAGRAWRRVRWYGLTLLVWSLVAWGAAHALIVRAPLAREADALVVLSGSATYVERTRFAAELFGEGRGAVIILTNDNQTSGWSNDEQRNPLFVERAANELKSAGVASEKIVVLPRAVSSTHDEALLLREYAETHQLRSLLFVTSAYHSRRALWTLRHVFAGSAIEVGLDSPPPGRDTPRPFIWWLFPRGWATVAGEYPKLVYYWFKYS